MQSTKNFYAVAEFFFFFFGFLYAIALLLWKNEIYPLEMEYVFNLADVPALFSAIVYFLGGIRLHAEEKYFFERTEDMPKHKDFFMLNLSLFLFGTFFIALYMMIDYLYILFKPFV